VHPGAAATGLVEAGGRVAGVRVSGGVVDADLVIDATGECSPVPGWLAELGRVVPEHSSPCGITYYTRFWVLHRNADPGELNCGHSAGGSFDRYSCLAFPADNGTFSVTFGVLPEDQDLHGLRLTQAFDAAAEIIPAITRWVDSSVAVPISGVAVMAGLHNRLRVLAPSGVPVLPGLLGVGDAVCTTNPAHGRGATLGLETALACALAVLAHGSDPEAASAAADAAQQEQLAPWFADSVAQDDARLARWRPDPAGSAADPDPVGSAEAFLAAQADPQLWAQITPLQHLLRRPDEVLGDPDTAARVREVLHGLPPTALEAPSHDRLAALTRTSAARSASVHGVSA
jgi:flavin-dependent dehydrogenase